MHGAETRPERYATLHRRMEFSVNRLKALNNLRKRPSGKYIL